MKKVYQKGLVPTDIPTLEAKIKTALGQKESKDPTILAIRAGLPVIIGRKSEPLCPSNKTYNNTEKMLKIFHDNGIKSFVETKNIDSSIAKYATGVLVSIMPAPFGIHKIIEPGLPHPDERLKFAKEMKQMGLFVGITGEPLMIPPREGFYENLAIKFRDTGADHVNFGEFRTSNPTISHEKMKSAGLDLLSYMSYMKSNWVQVANEFMSAMKSVGLKCSSPDWVNFAKKNSCFGCCGIDGFGSHKFNFQYAVKVLEEKKRVHFSDLSKHNIFGEEYEKKFKKVWNSPKLYYSLLDIEGVREVGEDEDGRIYGYTKTL
jgi:DNA repair photolyase